MKIKDILDHFLSRAEWVDRNKTVDRVIVGDPEKNVSLCIVSWIPSFSAIRTVVERGIKLLVCHEPTFWDHFDDTPQNKPHCSEKLDYIERHGLTILRNHDCWDRWPEIGIPWAWATFLGLKGQPAVIGGNGYQHRYDIKPIPVVSFAQAIASRTATIGAHAVEVAGDPEKLVSKIGIGTGCACSISEYAKMECDCCIVCDDGISYWKDVQYAKDREIPVICVNHGTAEEPGMASLTQYINDHIKGVRAEHLQQECPFHLVGEDGQARKRQ